MKTPFFTRCRGKGDIRVTTSDGTTEVAREVAQLSLSGSTGELYFKAANIYSAQDVTFYIYYGNDTNPSDYAVNDTYGSDNVWNSGFAAVYHFPDGSSLSMLDSTTNSNDGSAGSGTPTAGTGQVDGGMACASASSQYMNGGNGSSVKLSGNMSVSCWVKFTTAKNTSLCSKDKETGGRAWTFDMITSPAYHNRLYINGSTNGIIDASSTLTTATWYYLSGTYTTGGVIKVFKNGVQDGSASGYSGIIPDVTANMTVGAREYSGNEDYLDGVIDEVRLSNVDRGVNWFLTEYRNMNSPSTFYTTYAQENQPYTRLRVNNLRPRIFGPGNAR
jgi:hypothetical protein